MSVAGVQIDAPKRRRARLRIAMLVGLSLWTEYSHAGDSLNITVAKARRGVDSLIDAPMLSIQLDDRSADALAIWSTQHVGDIVDLVIDGKVAMSATLRAPLTKGAMELTGAADRLDAVLPRLLDRGSTLALQVKNVEESPR